MRPFQNLYGALYEFEEVALSHLDSMRGLDYSKRYTEGAQLFNEEIIHYETIRRRHFKRIIRALVSADPRSNYGRVLDYGSGKGYLLHLLAKSNMFTQIRGIEILPELCAVSTANLMKSGHQNISVTCADARYYNDIDDIDTFFLFNPFPAEAMKLVAKRIEESIARHDRLIRLVYINSIHEKLVEECSCSFTCVCHIDSSPRYGCRSSVFIHC